MLFILELTGSLELLANLFEMLEYERPVVQA